MYVVGSYVNESGNPRSVPVIRCVDGEGGLSKLSSRICANENGHSLITPRATARCKESDKIKEIASLHWFMGVFSTVLNRVIP